MLKKMMLLATMAAAIAAFVVPAAAQAAASNWSMGGTELKEPGELTLTSENGKAKFAVTSGLGGVECHVTPTVDLTEKSDAGQITTFEVKECATFGLLKTVCGDLTKTPEPTGLPWGVTATNVAGVGVIDINKVEIDNTTKGGRFCPLAGGVINTTGVVAANPPTATLDNRVAATTVTLGGEVETTAGPATVEGTLSITKNSGTYGIL